MKQHFSTLLLAATMLSSMTVNSQSITPQTYGTTGISEVIHHFAPAPDGGFFLTGADFSKDPAGDSWVICTDPSGKPRWQWSYGGSSLDGGNAILPLPDGGAVMVGHSESYGRDCDGIAARFDANGTLLWHIAVGEAEDDAFYDVKPTADGGFICTGFTENYGAQGQDIWLVKLDANGNTIWIKHYGGIWDEFANKLIPADDGGYWLAGVTFSLSDNERKEILVAKTDKDGEMKSTWAYSFLNETVAYALASDADGHLIVAGNARQPDGNFDAVVAKIDAQTGQLNWMKTFGGPEHDELRGVAVTASGDIVVAGYSDNLSTPAAGDAFVLKINAAGEKIWLQKVGGIGVDDARAVYELPEGDIAIAGKTAENQSAVYNGYLMTLHPDGITLIDKESPLSPPDCILAPNPVASGADLHLINPVDFSVDFRLYDQSGGLVLSDKNVQPGKVALGNHQLPAGVYLAEIAAGSSGRVVQRIKLVVK